MLHRTFVLLFILLAMPTLRAQATPTPQPCSLPSRLSAGIRAGVVDGGLPNNVRRAPTVSATRLGQIPAGGLFSVLDGPRCAEGYVWWQVVYQGVTGWTAEGDPATRTYWLQPLPVLDVGGDMLAGCLEPPEDYTQVTLGAAVLNARTLAMLDHAHELYQAMGGTEVDFRRAITQGSYTGGYVAASFGTHDGGGALDLSVRSAADFRVLYDDIPLMLRALRVAGFAAWLREPDELYPGSPIHIHAIAIGDVELSPAARDQIDGAYGYLRGYNGLPQEDGQPHPDTSGEMVLCPWIATQDYNDMRSIDFGK